MDETLLSLSALQHYAYCPRQFALIHTEQVWADNFFTAQGNVLHELVDSGLPDKRSTVAPRAGAWIETISRALDNSND